MACSIWITTSGSFREAELGFRFENIEIGDRPELLFGGSKRKDQVKLKNNSLILNHLKVALLLPDNSLSQYSVL